MGEAGIEQETVTNSNDKHLQIDTNRSAAESGADAPETASIDDQDVDLAAVIAAWPGLSAEVREAIRTIIGCCKDVGAESEERHLP